MKLPFCSWKNTIGSLGYKIVKTKNAGRRKRKESAASQFQYGALEPKKLLTAAPQLGAFSSQALDEGQSLNFTATYSDADANDSHSVVVDWGDGALDTLAVSNGSFNLSHTFSQAGAFQPVVTITDGYSLSDQASFSTAVNSSSASLVSAHAYASDLRWPSTGGHRFFG